MGKKYNIHRDFAIMEKVTFSNLSPGAIHLYNAIGKLTCRLAKINPGVTVTKHTISSYDSAPMRVTVYEPSNMPDDAPCLLYFHGGGFVMGEMPNQLQQMCEYALRVPCKVIFVHYRLALKHPFPQGVEDCYSSLVWAQQNSHSLGIDAQRIAVGGDSAGGGLAAAVALMARDRKGPDLCLQMLIYPALDCDQQTESVQQFTDVPVWNSRLNAQMWTLYLREGDFGTLQYASPTKAQSFSHLPAAYIETAEFDCLRDEGTNYATSLREHGIAVQLEETKGTIHAYDGNKKSSITQASLAKRVDALKKAFAKTSSPIAHQM